MHLARKIKGEHPKAQEKYKEFVLAGIGDSPPWEKLSGQALLGDEGFIERMKPLLDDKNKMQEIPKTALAGTPNAPTNLKAASNAADKVTLTWTDNAVNETKFAIYRKASTGTFALLDTIQSAEVKSYTDTTATGNDSTTAYSYYIQACNTTGCSPATNTAVVPFRPKSPQGNSFNRQDRFHMVRQEQELERV